MTFEHYLFRRQFLITPSPCEPLNHWPNEPFGDYRIYAHPDVELQVVNLDSGQGTLALIGYAIDPDHPRRSNREVFADIARCADSVQDVRRSLYSMGGRFVLIYRNAADTFVFHDPCGLRSVYYARHAGATHVGSQPLILAQVMPLATGATFDAYHSSRYAKTLEHWLPCGLSLYENVHQLMPNHYLRLSTCDQKRYWPDRPIRQRQLDDIVPIASERIEGLMRAAANRFKLAVTMTAGMDTRMLLAATRTAVADKYFYTLQYRNLRSDSKDIRVSKRLLTSLGYEHHVLNCRTTMDERFADLYRRNASMAHANDWGHIAFGMLGAYPPDRVSVKGSCSEVARCAMYKSGKHPPVRSVEDLLDYKPYWNQFSFVRKHLADWTADALGVAAQTGVDLLDLFYWEHRMGGWQAQSQLEWDVVQEVFTPFNHRGLLELLLGVRPALRCSPNYLLFKRMCRHLWPQVLQVPVNPVETIKGRVKAALLRMGLDSTVKRAHRTINSYTCPRPRT